MNKINPYGMKSGIVKVIPPPDWRAELPALDQAIKTIRVKEPIKQDIMGTNGTYRQANILHQRSYNLPQWRQLCEQSEHQPPAKRGERRLNQDKPRPPTNRTKPASAPSASSHKKKPGRGAKCKSKAPTTEEKEASVTSDRLPTPVSPSTKLDDDTETIKQEIEDEAESPAKPKGGRQPKSISVSSRRKYNRREAAAKVDEAAFKDFKYELEGEDYSPERCEELERAYWKTLTYAPPLYGADMPGSLFDDQTTAWNLGKLENLLDVMGTKIPGVNTAYLYLGMWKATFAWHLEDVDLYSINFLHFGAPKQWYSISQGDARRFEAAMKSIWPTDAKACDQFLRHKTFLISPQHLLQNYNIKVNKIVHRPGEFVITFPYGYHSGYNLGYNCAEAVNFALDSWLEYGRVAKKCDCSQAQDSVWIDVREIERKLRGEETDYGETEDEEDEEDEDGNGPTDLPTPPESSGDSKIKAPRRKRKRPVNEKGDKLNVKRIRVRIKAPANEPCVLCPNDIPSEPLIPTEDGQKAHRMCALYIPETTIESGEKELVTDIKYIDKARLDLKCNYCRSKKGACFQCSQKKCTRAYHATCAAAAGVLVEQGEIPVFGEDGTEYKDWSIEFSCRFHRTKRDKKIDGEALGDDERIRKAASELKTGETVQMQYYRGDIFAGAVVENRKSEEMILVDILPRGYVNIWSPFWLFTNMHISERVEVEYKWLLIPDPADYHLQKPSANAIPLPKSFKAKESLNTSKRHLDDLPRPDDPFITGLTWAEFKNEAIPANPDQVKVDLSKENQIWYYLGKNSTEAKAQFTEDLANPRHNPKGHFLDTIPKRVSTAPRQSYAASYPSTLSKNTLITSKASSQPSQAVNSAKLDRPYIYKPRSSEESYRINLQAYRSQQSFVQQASSPPYNFGTDPRWKSSPTTSPAATPFSPTTSYTPASSYPKFSPTLNGKPQSTGVLAPPAHYRKPHATPIPPPKQNSPLSSRTQNSKPNPFAKYIYLQKEHNRSPLEYKSPYRPGGGFMNGYQGSLQKHLQQTLFHGRAPTAPPLNPNERMHPPNQQLATSSYGPAPSSAGGAYGAGTAHKQAALPPRQVTKPAAPNIWDKQDSALHPAIHPAIRQEYSARFHNQYQPPQRSAASTTSQGPPPQAQHNRQQQFQQVAQTTQVQPSLKAYQPTKLRSLPLSTHPPPNSDIRHTMKPPASQAKSQTPSTVTHQDAKALFPHQQYFQAPHSQGQAPNIPPLPQAKAQPQPLIQDQAAHQRDLPDVPADSTSLIERMMLNLRKATTGASSPS
jgi:hypothetical protein